MGVVETRTPSLAYPRTRNVKSTRTSFTFSNTMFACRSNALTLANNFLLFRSEMRTWL